MERIVFIDHYTDQLTIIIKQIQNIEYFLSNVNLNSSQEENICKVFNHKCLEVSKNKLKDVYLSLIDLQIIWSEID